ncbi:MAG TPA: hypothetical protein VMD09_14825 [Solirubrobacteraceae bacterium]|nr:hypothetical protein [Solirubrobacteraceae bacterium]
MTRPATSSRVLLVEDRRAGAGAPAAVSVRRYRLARLRFDGPAADAGARFEYLKRSHD